MPSAFAQRSRPGDGAMTGSNTGLAGVAATALQLGIRAYQIVLGPHMGGACRFEPSCSRYAHEAIEAAFL